MNELTVCALCGKGLAQPLGTEAMRHGHVLTANPCEGSGITVMTVDEWEKYWSTDPEDGEL